MSDEIQLWWQYAEDNKRSAEVLLSQSLFNPCIQNAQQAVEKYLKALLLAQGQPIRRTHSISELIGLLGEIGIAIPLSADDIDLLDSVYLPSKYPLGSAMPAFEANESICRNCLLFVEDVRNAITGFLKK
jgi:HEPN domain-containing protein